MDKYNGEEVNLKAALERAFFSRGRLFHHERVLLWFPSYFALFQQTHDYLMESDDVCLNEFPRTWKYYIAIMAVSCYDNQYLMELLEEQFLLSGGDSTWLERGLKCVPEKIRLLADLNETMAFRPWTITSSHIEFLVRPAPGGKAVWSYAEVIHAGSILATYHGLCSLVSGQGLLDDEELTLYMAKCLKGRESLQLTGNPGADSDISEDGQYLSEFEEKNLNYAKRKNKNGETEEEDGDKANYGEESEEGSSAYATQKDGKMTMSDSQALTYSESDGGGGSKAVVKKAAKGETLEVIKETSEEEHKEVCTKKAFSIHKANVIDGYKNFNNRESPVHDLETFSWKGHVIDLFSKFHPELVEAMAAQMSYAFDIPCLDRDQPYFLRQSIYEYMLLIYGIRDDQFNTQEINQVFHIEQKIYLKKIACSPSEVTKGEYGGFACLGPQPHEERCQVCLIVMETKKQIELVFLGKALQEHLHM